MNRSFYSHFSIILLILIGSFLFNGMNSCTTNRTVKNQSMNYDDYLDLWEVYKKYEKDGKFQDALKQLNKIEAISIDENNDEQLLKSLFYRLANRRSIEETPLIHHIEHVQKQLIHFDEVGLAIANSYLAELYNNYYSQNRYRISQLTSIQSEFPEDITQWTNVHFTHKIAKLYNASIVTSTANSPLSDYNAIIEELDSEEGVKLRSSIFDLLAHRAVDYFSNNYSTLDQPIYAFDFDQEEGFLASQIFRNAIFETKDKSSTIFQTILIFQQLENNHAKSDDAVLVDILLKRLQFSKQHNTNDSKVALYKNSLEKLYDTYKETTAGFIVGNKLIDFYIERNQVSDQPSSEENKYLIQAMSLIDELELKFQSKKQKETYKHYRSLILRRELSFSTEQVISANENILVHAEYKNLSNIEFEIYGLSPEDLKDFYKDNNKAEVFFTKSRLVEKGMIALPLTSDYRLNTVEFGINSKNLGSYFILLKSEDNKLQTWQLLHVSNIASSMSSSGELQVFDRNSGKPIQARIDGYQYSWSGRKRDITRVISTNTDSKGVFQNKDASRGIFIDIIKGDDHLFLNGYVNSRSSNYNQKRTSINAFTDRAIYRPGQKIFFKAIADEQTNGDDPELIIGKNIHVKLLDANYQAVEEQVLKTNGFGSINGSFSIPENLLNGNFQLQFGFDKDKILNQYSIRVEEYKRPKFNVEIDELKGSYKLDEEVTVQGNAQTFSGSAISDAKVSYFITRSQVYQYYYRRGHFSNSSKVIARGETRTDKNGHFSIDFIAEKDKSSRVENPVFNYELSVDITDASGETRGANQNVRAGSKAYIFKLDADNTFSPFDAKQIELKVSNQNNIPASIKASIELFAIKDDAKIYRERYWNFPKNQILNKSQFELDFPNYSYTNHSDIEAMEMRSIKKEIQDIDGSLNYDLSNLSPGTYALKITHPDAVELISQINIIDKTKISKKLPFAVETEKMSSRPGENVEVDVYSPYEQMQLFVDVLRHGKMESRQYITLNNYKRLSFPVHKSDRGGIQIVVTAVYNNRFYSENISIDVPYDDKKLDLKWESFRSDIYPGSEEKWRIKITDKENNPVNAEILSSMYDASLDEFVKQPWNPFNFNRLSGNINVSKLGFARAYSRQFKYEHYINKPYFGIKYPFLATQTNHYGGHMMRNRMLGSRGNEFIEEMDMAPASAGAPPAPMKKAFDAVKIGDVNAESSQYMDDQVISEKPKSNGTGPALRTNLKETVFFFPELKTNEQGETLLEFTMNEALTEWNLQTFAHTKDASFVLDKKKVKTSKDIMVFPNGPRFFRHGDRTSIIAKVQNNTEDKILAKAYIKLINPFNNEEITNLLIRDNINQEISIDPKGNARVIWEFNIPNHLAGLTYQVYAQSNDHSDGEENTAVVLTNRKLITESLAITLPKNSTKTVDFKALEKLSQSSTIEAQLMDISVTSNPSWLAVQSLPYLIEYQYKCSEQVFSRYFGNALARHILDKNPIIEEVYSEWKKDGDLLSALSKNQELKSAILEQTPWVMDALNEEEQMERMSFLFDQKRIQAELASDLKILIERQNQGGFPWFPGGRPNWFITQHILEGLGQLHTMGIINKNDDQFKPLITQAIKFINQEFIEFDEIKKDPLYLSPIVIHYMYVQSFYNEYSDKNVERRLDKYVALAKEKWLNYGIMNQGHLALYFDRNDEKEWSEKIVESLLQRTIFKENLGRYWKEVNGYNWNQSNIETQALLIAAFDEISGNDEEIDEMKQWLLSNKQTNSWKSTKATTHAIYALIERGEKWIDNNKTVRFKVSEKDVAVPTAKLVKATGQYSKKYRGEEVNIEKKSIEFTNENDHIAWASSSFQYWEELDKIDTYQETPLKLRREYFRKITTDEGRKLIPIKESETLSTGDLLTVRLSLIVDRPMEFIHLQDMRAAGTEPVDVLSSYQWKGGLSYYMETRDVATNFFVDYLPRGEYTIEYDQRIVQPGNYSAGISTIQSMYAPEFGAHSKGMKLNIIAN